jgi:hypothetical protein
LEHWFTFVVLTALGTLSIAGLMHTGFLLALFFSALIVVGIAAAEKQ